MTEKLREIGKQYMKDMLQNKKYFFMIGDDKSEESAIKLSHQLGAACLGILKWETDHGPEWEVMVDQEVYWEQQEKKRNK